MKDIKQVAVIGAGVMGAAIAAHFANAGIPVLLLDIVPANATDRNQIAAGAIERMKKMQPAPFMSKSCARLVTPGNVEDDMGKLAECDWIVEAILEQLDLKQALYHKIDAVRRPGSVVSSNTSTIPLALLLGGMPESFACDFMITHFFNPPRYMRLLELITGPSTAPESIQTITEICDRILDKGVVVCKDRPGFIANRLGTYWMQIAMVEAFERKLSVEVVDALMSKPIGVPPTGVFGLIDLVGLDLIPHITQSLSNELPADDPFQAYLRDNPTIARLIEQGYTGRKGKGGFYRLDKSNGKKPSWH